MPASALSCPPLLKPALLKPAFLALPLSFALCLSVAPQRALGGEFSDLVFQQGQVPPPGAVPATPKAEAVPGLLIYARSLDVPPPPPEDPAKPRPAGLQPDSPAWPMDIDDQRITLESGASGRALWREEAGQRSPLTSFPASGPDPILLYFLESTARNLAEMTGGSPFYIRNRMREALGAAALPAPGDPVVMRPFANDPNRPRLGPLADLEIRLTLAATPPLLFLSLSADTAPGAGGYHHRMTLLEERP